MDNNVTALERAFEIAKSGRVMSLDNLKKQLKSEGYSIAQISGRSLTKQLGGLIKDSLKSAEPVPGESSGETV